MLRANILRCLIVTSALFFSACQTTGEGGTTTISGKNLGNAEWGKSSMYAGRLDLPVWGRARVKEVEFRKLPKIDQQWVELSNGIVRLAIVNNRAGYTLSSRKEFHYIAKHYKWDGIKILPANANEVDLVKENQLQYFARTVNNHSCIVYQMLKGPTRQLVGGNGRQATLRGVFCGNEGETEEAFLRELLPYLHDIKIKKSSTPSRAEEEADAASESSSGGHRYKGYTEVCTFAITPSTEATETYVWNTWADYAEYVSEAKSRNYTPQKCARMIGLI